MKAIEIEIDGPRNECLAFRPLPGRTVRGRFDLNRVGEPLAKLETAKWPFPIPGQRIGVQPDGTGYIAEPLHDAEHAAVREKIIKAGLRLAPDVESMEGVDAEAWLYWMARAVQSGVAQVVKGELPAKLPASPRKNFIMAEPPQSSSDRLAVAIKRQNDLMAQLLARMGK